MNELVKLLNSKLSYVICFIIFLFIPGYLAIFLFNQELFLSLDVIKLIILGISIPTPPLILSMFVFFIITTPDNNDEYPIAFILALAGNAICFYMLLLLKLLVGITVDYAIIALAAFSIIMGVIAAVMTLKSR